MADTLTALDATFLELEQHDDGALMSIGGVMVFDPLPDRRVPSLEEVCERVGARLARLPRFSQRLSAPRTGGFAWPQWVDDPRFEVRDHVRHVALPAPGDPGQLCDWAGDFYSHRLDRARPLWEMALIEGLENGRWALAHKMHHSLPDGDGSLAVVQVLLDPEPDPAPVEEAGPTHAQQAGPPGDGLTAIPQPLVQAIPQPVVQAAGAGARTAAGAAHAILHPREALARSLSLADLFVQD